MIHMSCLLSVALFMCRSSKSWEVLAGFQREQIMEEAARGGREIPEEGIPSEQEDDPSADEGFDHRAPLTKVLKLRMPVAVRWNSTFYMIER